MYRLTLLWMSICAVSALLSYVVGRRHGRSAHQRQLRGSSELRSGYWGGHQ